MEREEAIKILRDTHDKSLFSVRNALETLIPELRESEDEKVRKEIVSIVKAYRENCIDEGTHRFDDCLSWLEKQEEQKPVEWTELTWKDIVELECIINNVHYDFSAGIGQESFGKEVLERFRNKKDGAEVDACEQKPAQKFRVGDMIISTNNPHLTYKILEVGHINELGNPEYKVEIFEDGKPGIMDKPHNIHYMECHKVDEWGKLIEQKPAECINIEELAKHIKAEFESFRNLLKKKGIDYQPTDAYWTGYARLFVSSAKKLQKPAEWSEDKDFEDCLTELACELYEQRDESPENTAFKESEILKKWTPILLKKAQRKVDWSEEDERILNELLDHCNTENATWYNWLKSFPLNLKKKNEDVAKLCSNEWSEEDEKVFCEITQNVNAYDAYTGTIYQQIEHHDKKINWLKSIRPHWKPSDEQMDTLERWLLDNKFKGDSRYVYPIFESIYNDLKKLM